MRETVPHRWSWRTLRIAPSFADVIMLPDIHFSKIGKNPSYKEEIKKALLATSTQNFFKFFYRLSFLILDSLV